MKERGVVAGSGAAELISAGDGADTMLGGGGADTYAIGNGDSDGRLAPDAFGVVGDVINEIGGDLSLAPLGTRSTLQTLKA